jgi:predicted nucleic acid-binding protein
VTAVVDTSVLFGYANTEDAHHDAALGIVEAIDAGEIADARLTNYLLEELLDLTRVHLGHDVAIDLLDRLQASAGFEIDHATRSDFSNSEQLFREDHQLSFVDATTVSYMEREGIDTLYSFDDDFDPYVDRRTSW